MKNNSLKIVLDPGHGKWSRPTYEDGTCETDVVWQTAQILAHLLTDQGHRVTLTKQTRDACPSCLDRARLSVKARADLFVSLHCNAATARPDRSGVFGIFYGGDTREERAPDSEIRAPNGRRLARTIAWEIHETTALPLLGVQGAALWWKHPKNLGVLAGARNWANTGAACLVEAGFLTHPQDRQLLGGPDGPALYALGCARGIHRYANLEIPGAWRMETRLCSVMERAG